MTLVLHQPGHVQIRGAHEVISRRGWGRIQAAWRVVELWTLSAQDLLAANDVGLIPWVPLTHFDGPPEPVFEECRQRIEQQAAENERANLLAVSQVLTRLRYNVPGLLSIFGGSKAMIESPLIQELMAQNTHKAILLSLEGRFGTLPAELVNQLRAIMDSQQLENLARQTGTCSSLEAFQVLVRDAAETGGARP
jgi:hypothetical protein